MAEELYSVLTRFHREVMIPDMQRMVGGLRDDMLSHVLPVFHREVMFPDMQRMVGDLRDEMLSHVLPAFHREVVVPDIQRIVGDAVAPFALRDETLSHFDAIYKRFDRLESEYQTLKAAVRRIEEKLAS